MIDIDKKYVFTLRITMRNGKSYSVLYSSDKEYADEAITELIKDNQYIFVNRIYRKRFGALMLNTFDIQSIEYLK